jgi:hypothetical protein
MTVDCKFRFSTIIHRVTKTLVLLMAYIVFGGTSHDSVLAREASGINYSNEDVKFKNTMLDFDRARIKKRTQLDPQKQFALLRQYNELHAGNVSLEEIDRDFSNALESARQVVEEGTLSTGVIRKHFGVAFQPAKRVEILGLLSFSTEIASNALDQVKPCLALPLIPLDQKRQALAKTTSFDGRLRILSEFSNDPNLSVLIIPQFLDRRNSRLGEEVFLQNATLWKGNPAVSSYFWMNRQLRNKTNWTDELNDKGRLFFNLVDVFTRSGHLNVLTKDADKPEYEGISDAYYSNREFVYRDSKSTWRIYHRFLDLAAPSNLRLRDEFMSCGEMIVERRLHGAGTDRLPAEANRGMFGQEAQLIRLISLMLRQGELPTVEKELQQVGLRLKITDAPSSKIPKVMAVVDRTNSNIFHSVIGLPVYEADIECKSEGIFSAIDNQQFCNWQTQKQRLTLLPKIIKGQKCMTTSDILTALAQDNDVSIATFASRETNFLSWVPFNAARTHSLAENWAARLLDGRLGSQRFGSGYEAHIALRRQAALAIPESTLLSLVRPMKMPPAQSIPWIYRIAKLDSQVEAILEIQTDKKSCATALQITK